MVISGTFRELLLFLDLDLPGLAKRLHDGHPDANDQVQKLFEGLSECPDVQFGIYETAISVIKVYSMRGHTKEATLLELRLSEIAMKMSDVEKP